MWRKTQTYIPTYLNKAFFWPSLHANKTKTILCYHWKSSHIHINARLMFIISSTPPTPPSLSPSRVLPSNTHPSLYLCSKLFLILIFYYSHVFPLSSLFFFSPTLVPSFSSSSSLVLRFSFPSYSYFYQSHSFSRFRFFFLHSSSSIPIIEFFCWFLSFQCSIFRFYSFFLTYLSDYSCYLFFLLHHHHYHCLHLLLLFLSLLPDEALWRGTQYKEHPKEILNGGERYKWVLPCLRVGGKTLHLPPTPKHPTLLYPSLSSLPSSSSISSPPPSSSSSSLPYSDHSPDNPSFSLSSLPCFFYFISLSLFSFFLSFSKIHH